eukprot:TRINITY_DN5880_c0_g1_i1.p1 TRINITY_DN5880_c0_g1~~TRINITY_DN5880_c0_g1_i1.p1  ORF type:complete len:740 (-),score=186.23 TRINITY_DN5880_c0_g1_i1:37-2256(-)
MSSDDSVLTAPERRLVQSALSRHNDEEVFLALVETARDIAKPTKTETRFLLIGKSRIFFFKRGGKLVEQCHLLDLVEVSTKVEKNLFIHTKTFVCLLHDDPAVLEQILINLMVVFAEGLPGKNSPFVIQPAQREERIRSSVKEILNKVQIFCGGFVNAYRTACNQLMCPVVEDLAWDIDHIYPIQGITEFNAFEIAMRQGNLTTNDWKALLQALEHNDHFTALVLEHIRLDKEVWNSVGTVLQKNTALQRLVIRDCNVRSEFFVRLASAVEYNHNLSITHLELVDTTMEEKGLLAFVSSITYFKKGLITLNLSNCGLDKKSAPVIIKALEGNPNIFSHLRVFNIAGNKLDAESCRSLSNFFLKANYLVELNLSNTDPEQWIGLTGRPLLNLRKLDVSGVVLSAGKDNKQYDFMKFLETAPNIRKLNLSKTFFPSENFTDLFDISKNLQTLDLSDNNMTYNDLGMLIEILKPKFGNSLSLKHLHMNRNFEAVTKQKGENFLPVFVNFLQVCQLESLYIAGSPKKQLKGDLIPIIFGLMGNKTVRTLDISGHGAGDSLAVALSKLLQVNGTIESLFWDENGITASGYFIFKTALSKNKSLVNMSMPIADVTNAYQNWKDIAKSTKYSFPEIMKQIEEILCKNALRAVKAERRGSADLTELVNIVPLEGQSDDTEKDKKAAYQRTASRRHLPNIDVNKVSQLHNDMDTFLSSPNNGLNKDEVERLRSKMLLFRSSSGDLTDK